MDCHRCGGDLNGEQFNWRGHLVHESCFHEFMEMALRDVDERVRRPTQQIVAIAQKGKVPYNLIEEY